MDYKKHFNFSVSDNPLPLFIENIGYNHEELEFDRPEGYPYYHWLQTNKGQGIFNFDGQKFKLPPGKAVLLTPYTPHSYYADRSVDDKWSTFYITFSGKAIDSILNSLDMNHSAIYEETKKVSFIEIVKEIIKKIELEDQYFEFESSAELYRFLMMLKKYGKVGNKLSILQSYEKIRPIVEWLELVYRENIGLAEISEKAQMSPQHLNTLFHDTFGLSPYSFLVQLRIREAKTLLLSDTKMTLKEVSKSVGFNGVSNFVATFKRREGITPSVYRSLHV